MEQMIKFIPGQDGSPGQFMSPLPIKPFNISSVKGNRATADEQNRQMVLRLQKDPEALEQVREEMKKLQDLGFIKKLKDLPRNIQEELEIPCIISTRWPCGGQICYQMKRQRNWC